MVLGQHVNLQLIKSTAWHHTLVTLEYVFVLSLGRTKKELALRIKNDAVGGGRWEVGGERWEVRGGRGDKPRREVRRFAGGILFRSTNG